MFGKKKNADFLDVLTEEDMLSVHDNEEGQDEQWLSRYQPDASGNHSSIGRESSYSNSVVPSSLPIDVQMRQKQHSEQLAESQKDTSPSVSSVQLGTIGSNVGSVKDDEVVVSEDTEDKKKPHRTFFSKLNLLGNYGSSNNTDTDCESVEHYLTNFKEEEAVPETLPNTLNLAVTVEPILEVVADVCTCQSDVQQYNHRMNQRYSRILDTDQIDLGMVKKRACTYTPSSLRCFTWQLLLGNVSPQRNKIFSILHRKRLEYKGLLVSQCLPYQDSLPFPESNKVPTFYPDQTTGYVHTLNRAPEDHSLLHQIRQDTPRTTPSHALMHLPCFQAFLERVLFVWGCKNPAAGYVQGMNDLLVPLIYVSVSDVLHKLIPINALMTHNQVNLYDMKLDIPDTTAAKEYSVEVHKMIRDSKFSWMQYLDSLASIVVPLQPHVLELENNAQTCIIHDQLLLQNQNQENIPPASLSNTPTSNSIEQVLLPSMNILDFPIYSNTRDPPTVEQANTFLNSLFTPALLSTMEADCYLAFTNVIAKVQDNYVSSQPGIAKMISHLEDIVCRLNNKLYTHIIDHHVMFIQFAFRWFNCLFLREFPLVLLLRLFDTALSCESADEFTQTFVYFGATVLLSFEQELLSLDSQDIIMFIQHQPTSKWTVERMDSMLSQTYVYQSLLRNSSHLNNK